MPKSARKILLVLSSSSSVLTQKEIVDKTGLSIRSVKGSLKLLKEKNLIEEIVVLGDMRYKEYRTVGDSKEGEGALAQPGRVLVSKTRCLGSNPRGLIKFELSGD